LKIKSNRFIQPKITMEKKKLITLPRILILFPVIAIGIQFIPVDLSNPKTSPENDFITLKKLDTKTATLLRNACYDCHSDQVRFPWYSHVAPVSWLLSGHVEEARNNFNFSQWGTYPEHEQIGISSSCYDEIADDEMPLKSYTLMHPDAQLTDAQKEILKDLFYQE